MALSQLFNGPPSGISCDARKHSPLSLFYASLLSPLVFLPFFPYSSWLSPIPFCFAASSLLSLSFFFPFFFRLFPSLTLALSLSFSYWRPLGIDFHRFLIGFGGFWGVEGGGGEGGGGKIDLALPWSPPGLETNKKQPYDP